MSTRSSARNLFPPLDNPELTIRKRSRADPTLLNKFEMATEINGDPSVPDLRTMEELCQPSLNGRVGPIAPIAIQATNFGLKNDMIQQSIKVNGVTDNALSLYLFPRSLTHHATAWFDPQRSESSSSITSSFDPKIVALKAEMAKINKNLMRVLQVNQQVKAVTPNCETCGGPHAYNDCPATVGQTQNVYAAGAYQGNTITNPNKDLKGITTRSGTAYQGPTIPTTSSSLPQVVERETEVTKDTVPPTNNESTKYVQPPVFQVENPIPNSDPLFHDQKLRDKAIDHKEIFFQIFQDLNFNISFADALILMPKFGPTIKTLLTNKDKLYELARTLLNKHCSVVLLKKFPEKLEDLDKFLIPCDFSGMDECLALADLGASINLMPLSMWNKLSLPELSPTCMTLELADRSISFLGFFDEITSGNPTPYYDPIVSTSSPTLTPFGDSDFLLEEVDAFLALEDDPTSPEVDHSYFDPEGGILLLESFLNDDPSLPPPN
nr:reverse transcriptase domain-containing protein [Tanacetum cinerariifolium]